MVETIPLFKIKKELHIVRFFFKMFIAGRTQVESLQSSFTQQWADQQNLKTQNCFIAPTQGYGIKDNKILKAKIEFKKFLL